MRDSAGRPLRPVAPGVYQVMPGRGVRLLSGHDPRSYGSRYPLGRCWKLADVLGVARLLWVLG